MCMAKPNLSTMYELAAEDFAGGAHLEGCFVSRATVEKLLCEHDYVLQAEELMEQLVEAPIGSHNYHAKVSSPELAAQPGAMHSPSPRAAPIM